VARMLEDFVNSLQNAKDVGDLQGLLHQRMSQMGFNNFAYLALKPPSGAQNHLVLTTYPGEWADRYTEMDYVNHDPIVPMAITSIKPFTWDETIDKRVNDKPKLILNEATEFGLRQGVTIPLHGPSAAFATLSVCFDERREAEFAKRYEVMRHELLLTALYFHDTVTKLAYGEGADRIYKISPRERECLLWTSRGKTAWEVSQITHLSEKTVHHYLASAMRKFGVFSKHHAVVKSIALGIIIP